MAKNTQVIPYTEIVERVTEIVREDSPTGIPRVRGAVQDVHNHELPREEDWIFHRATSSLNTVAEYKSGTVSIDAGTDAAYFSSAVSMDATFTTRKIKIQGNANIYDVTYVDANTATLRPFLSGGTNVSNAGYTIYQPHYPLAGDFDRFLRDGGLQLFQGGAITLITEEEYVDYYEEVRGSPSPTPSKFRFVGEDTAGNVRLELRPGPSTVLALPYDYMRKVRPMRETTGGSATVSGGATTVNFQEGATLAVADTGWWFRIDAFGRGEASEWYRVIAVSAANSTVTLQTAFGVSGATSAGYTLCTAPDYPTRMHPAILWGAARNILPDQNDPQFPVFDERYNKVIVDAKRLYKTRIYNQDVDTIFEDYQFRR